MAIFKSLIARLGMETSAWSSGNKIARDEVKSTEEATKKSFKSIVSELNSSFGKKSTLGQSLKLAAGAGAVGALSKAFSEVKNFAEEMGKLGLAMQKGEANWGDFVEKVAGSLPVLGAAWQAGRAIREAVTHEQAQQAADLDEAMSLVNKTSKKLQEQKEAKSLIAQLRDEERNYNESATLAGIDDDSDRGIQAAIFTAQHELDKLHAKIDAQLKDSNANKADIIAEQAKVELSIEAKKNADILKINQDRQEKESEDALKAAQDEAKRDEELRGKAIEKLQQQQNDQVKSLEKERKQILGSVDNDSYRATSSPQARLGGVALYTPSIATKMQQLTEAQLERLKSIDENLEKFTGKRPDDDDAVANF